MIPDRANSIHWNNLWSVSWEGRLKFEWEIYGDFVKSLFGVSDFTCSFLFCHRWSFCNTQLDCAILLLVIGFFELERWFHESDGWNLWLVCEVSTLSWSWWRRMNIVKGVADLIRRTSAGHTGESSSFQAQKCSPPGPRIRFR